MNCQVPSEKSVPQGFVAEVREAETRRDRGRLGLLRCEAERLPWANAAISLLDEAVLRLPVGPQWDRALLFTGHRMDAPGREHPRFPPSAEDRVRDAITTGIQEALADTLGSVVGIAGGASGGDLLFHEACHHLHVPSLLRLTLPPEQFAQLSVLPAGLSWKQRLDALLARLGPENTAVLTNSANLPAWMSGLAGYDIWQRTNLWLLQEGLALARTQTLLALWDGREGEGPGGTKDMVEAAKACGVTVAPILRP